MNRERTMTAFYLETVLMVIIFVLTRSVWRRMLLRRLPLRTVKKGCSSFCRRTETRN